jgi:uncharacterized protein YdaU (DUF1376 family)
MRLDFFISVDYIYNGHRKSSTISITRRIRRKRTSKGWIRTKPSISWWWKEKKKEWKEKECKKKERKEKEWKEKERKEKERKEKKVNYFTEN